MMRSTRFRISALLSLLLVLGLLAGCGQNAKAPAAEATKPAERVIKHLAGETKIVGIPKRIVVLTQNYADPLIAIGVKPVASASYVGMKTNGVMPYIADQMQGITLIGDQTNINIEAVIAAQPDLIIGRDGAHEKIYDTLSKVAPTVLIEDMEDWRETFRQIAHIAGREEQANQWLADYDKKVKAAREKLSTAVGTQSVMYMRVLPKEFRVYGGNRQIADVLYNDLGLKAAPGVPTKDWSAAISMEKLPEMNPDHLLLQVGLSEGDAGQDRLKELQASPLWANLTAVKQNQVHPMPHWTIYNIPLAKTATIDLVLKALVK